MSARPLPPALGPFARRLGAAGIVAWAVLASAPPRAGAAEAGEAPAVRTSLAGRAAGIDAARMGAAVRLDGPLRAGRAEVTPAPGTPVRELRCGGVRCGVAVDGAARLVYRVDDRFSAPVAERNVRRATDLDGRFEGTTFVVDEALEGALVWGWDLANLGPPETGETAAGETAAAAGAALPAWASRLLADRRFPGPSLDLLPAEANGVAGQRYALLQGKQESLLLTVDTAFGEETLHRLGRSTDHYRATFSGGVRAVAIATQPAGREWWQRPFHTATAVNTAVSVTNEAGNRLAFRARVRLRAERDGLAIWQANLVDGRWDDDGHQRRLTVSEARVDGRPARFLHRDAHLVVALERTLAAGETAEVEVVYAGDLVIREVGNSFWLLGTWPWYPRQELGGERGTIEIAVDVPAPDVPFASGTEIERATADGRTRIRTQLADPMQFAVVIAGKYRVVEETRDGLTARVAAYAIPKEEAARELLDKLFSARRFFESFFDQPYPFPELVMIEIADWGFGQAPPGIVFFTSEFFAAAPVDRRRRVYFQDLDARYLHEIAHGWWGHVVKMSSPEDRWICEGFAEYTAALALWRLRGGDLGDYAFDELVKKWRRAAVDLTPGASLALMDRIALTDDTAMGDYWRLRYAKGPLAVHGIRLELQRQKGSAEEGDRYFIAFLRSYLRQNRMGWGTTAAMVETLSDLTGTDWQPWFDRYVYGTEMPPLPPG